jgi:hypothetical protein
MKGTKMGKLKEMMINDTDNDEEEQANILGLAIVKAHAFAQEYDPNSGRVKDRLNYHALKEGYTEGFLAGFTYKITGDKDL